MKRLTRTEIMMIGGGGESSVDTRTRVNHYGRGISANYGGRLTTRQLLQPLELAQSARARLVLLS